MLLALIGADFSPQPFVKKAGCVFGCGSEKSCKHKKSPLKRGSFVAIGFFLISEKDILFLGYVLRLSI
jgi:hypothetical protein